LWGEQTQRSLEHFSIGQDLMPREMITAYAILKKAAANANRADGRLDNRPTNRCCQLAGTALGGKTPVHPDDHVNMSLNAGLVLSLAGFFAVLAMPIVGRLLGRGTDARWLIGAGLLLMTAGNYWMSQLNLDIGPVQVIWPRVVLVAGLAVCFAPANVAAYLYTPMALRGAAVGLLSLLRNEGGSVGASLAQTFQERRDQFHTLRLVEYLDPFNAAANSFLAHARGFFLQQAADPVAARQFAWQELENLRQQQASSLAYFDSFWIIAVLTLAVAFLVLVMKRSVAEKGSHAGPE
jgi:MFS transporter, DHA2 family, multidrug resistance protein